jgi:hypothetical protein
VDNAIKTKVRDLLLNPAQISFDVATPEQCAKDEKDEYIEEIFTVGARCGSVHNVPFDAYDAMQNTSLDARAMGLVCAANNHALAVALQASTEVNEARRAQIATIEACKDAEIAALKACKDAEMARKDAEIAALKASKDAEIAAVKSGAAKDMEIMQLRMQLRRTVYRPRMDDADDVDGGGEQMDPLIQHRQDSVRRFWLIMYEAENELGTLDFPDVGVMRSVYTFKSSDRWISLLALSSKKRFVQVGKQLKYLEVEGKITKGWVEECSFNSGTDMINVSSLVESDETKVVLKYMMQASKKIVDGAGVVQYPMVRVA